ncbi:alkaline phosphatase [Caballeronia glebae]|uniref:Alkaline phosphatase n=1 Tax=Caballeronia glebae TaxID=1777143 RepID=A0A158CC27_9BURK|nr:DeoR/GlpR family DNA-binding transcription regulator [Caballeronia glebae]SAK79854.1 alkaline phosphatase [Caballeronia glebae]
MWQKDRHQRIRALLSMLGRVSNERIMAELCVSRETVRRDLLDLEEAGALRRVHGGAVPSGDEAPITERARANVRAKAAIARAAIGIVHDGQTVFVDAGTTTAILADELAKLANLTIVTNSVDVALRLRGASEPGERVRAMNEVILLGGMLSERAAATTGATTVLDIRRYRADLAMLSPVGIDRQHGASNFDRAEAEIARAMVENADRVAILADHSKIGQRSRITFCAPREIDILVTDRKSGEAADFRALKKTVGDLVLA